MANRWIRKPDLVLPPVTEGVTYIGFVIPAWRQYCYFQLDLRFTIRGTLQCERGGVRETTLTLKCKVMVPVSPTEMVMSRMLPGPWLRGAWMTQKGIHVLATVLRTESTVERTIKTLIESTDAICSGKFNIASSNTIVLGSPIWLDGNYRPMIVLNNPHRAAAPDPQRGKRV